MARGVKHLLRKSGAACTYFTRANHCSLFKASWIQFTFLICIKPCYINVLSSQFSIPGQQAFQAKSRAVQYVPETTFPDVERPGCEDDRFPSIAEDENAQRITTTSLYIFAASTLTLSLHFTEHKPTYAVTYTSGFHPEKKYL